MSKHARGNLVKRYCTSSSSANGQVKFKFLVQEYGSRTDSRKSKVEQNSCLIKCWDPEPLYFWTKLIIAIIIEKWKTTNNIMIPSIILTLHPLMQSRIRTLRRPRLARQKSLTPGRRSGKTQAARLGIEPTASGYAWLCVIAQRSEHWCAYHV